MTPQNRPQYHKILISYGERSILYERLLIPFWLYNSVYKMALHRELTAQKKRVKIWCLIITIWNIIFITHFVWTSIPLSATYCIEYLATKLSRRPFKLPINPISICTMAVMWVKWSDMPKGWLFSFSIIKDHGTMGPDKTYWARLNSKVHVWRQRLELQRKIDWISILISIRTNSFWSV